MSRFLLVCAIAACGGSSRPPPPIHARSTVPTSPPPPAPRVASPSVLANDDRAPPILVLVDARGARSLAAAASWTDVSVARWSAGPTPASDASSARHVRAAVGKDPKAAVEAFVDGPGAAPATPPERGGEDGEDDAGTAMALEEGTMGKRDSDRSEGQYRMQRVNHGGTRGPRDAAAARDADPDDAVRRSTIVGEVTEASLADVPAVVIADPRATALAVVRAVSELQAMIGVVHDGAIRPLEIQFQPAKAGEPIDPDRWLEVRLTANLITVEAVPSEATPLVWADLDGELTTALADARARRAFPDDAPVDVLVAPEVTAQQLVDVLVALDGAGVKMIGLGRMAQPAAREGPPPQLGELDKPTIRNAIRHRIGKIRFCYEKELVAKPGLAGTVTVRFVIGADGKVVSASGTGVDPAVASCVAAVIEELQFPRPSGGGNVTVIYPFTFSAD